MAKAIPLRGSLRFALRIGLSLISGKSHFSALRATLEGGVPTARNKMGGHGDGTDPTAVPQHLAAYVLHMTASTLVFLIEAEKQLP